MRTLKLGGRKRVSASIWRREHRFGDPITEPFLGGVELNTSGTTREQFRFFYLSLSECVSVVVTLSTVLVGTSPLAALAVVGALISGLVISRFICRVE